MMTSQLLFLAVLPSAAVIIADQIVAAAVHVIGCHGNRHSSRYSTLQCTNRCSVKTDRSQVTMGATLSSRVEWTSASNKGGKLDFSKTNENILREIVKYVENLCRNNPREAQVVFKHPFVWTSSLALSNFSSLKSGDDYVLRSVAESAPPPSIDPAHIQHYTHDIH